MTTGPERGKLYYGWVVLAASVVIALGGNGQKVSQGNALKLSHPGSYYDYLPSMVQLSHMYLNELSAH